MRARAVVPDRLRGRTFAVAACAIVVAYYLFFTWKSLGLFFDRDDMMNTWVAWSKPLGELLLSHLLFWTDSARPLGQLWYRTLFAAAGFSPLPFHVALLTLGLMNLGLCAWFVKLVSGSSRVAAFAAILFAFHTRLMEVWFRTAVIYDALCFTFFYTAVCLYVTARRRGEDPGLGRCLAITAAFILALDAKEIAVALPLILVLYDLLYQGFRWRSMVLPACLGLLSLPYIAAKTLGANALTVNPYYQPEYTLARFTERWSEYLGFLFVRPLPVSHFAVAALLLLPLLAAAALRSRHLLFAWAILFCTTLPVAFLPYRGGFVLFIAWAGWVLYAALVADSLVQLVATQPRHREYAGALVFLLLGWRWGKINLHDQRLGDREWLYGDIRVVQALVTQIAELQPTLPRGARVLFLEDAFGTDEWTPVFVLRLQNKDATLVVDRVKMMDPKPATQDGYQYVFTYQNGRYRRLKP